jgi:hypothetical protein
MWNGQNYLLKMPSDLDYLHTYKAIRKWVGFQIKRNPFVVPDPMDTGIVGPAGSRSVLVSIVAKLI